MQALRHGAQHHVTTVPKVSMFHKLFFSKQNKQNNQNKQNEQNGQNEQNESRMTCRSFVLWWCLQDPMPWLLN